MNWWLNFGQKIFCTRVLRKLTCGGYKTDLDVRDALLYIVLRLFARRAND